MGVGEGYGLKRRVQATYTLLFEKVMEKRGLKLALAVRKTRTTIDRASQLIFSIYLSQVEKKLYKIQKIAITLVLLSRS